MVTFLSIFFLLNIKCAPPGTIKIKNYYIDKTEIQNIHWQEYVWQKNKKKDTKEAPTNPSDTLKLWYQRVENPYKPVCYLTYEQALDYCKWRSEFVSASLNKKVTYRLPSREEWREIAAEVVRINSKQTKRDLIKTKNKIKWNTGKYVLIETERPRNRVYHMFDNVTEMTSEKGIAMGANNYELTTIETNLNRTIKYGKPNSYLGFRCIAEIEE